MSDFDVETHRQLLRGMRPGCHLAVLDQLVKLYSHPALLRGKYDSLDPQKLLAESAKLRATVDLLRRIRTQGEKAVIFVRLIDLQQILAVVFKHALNIEVDILNGKAKSGSGSDGTKRTGQKREEMLENFRRKQGFNVIILSPQVAGIGLTITEANHVIHYQRWWNPAVESQGTDRVYRIGQEREVHVYLPILQDSQGRIPASFDQKLDELLRFKYEQAREFLSPIPAEPSLAHELIASLSPPLGSDGDKAIPLSSDDIDKMNHTHFESLVACLLERDGNSTVLTACGNDGGADVLAHRDGWITVIQVKHTRGGSRVAGSVVGDLLGARQNYDRVLRHSQLRMLGATNGEFSREIREEARHLGVELMERADLMRAVRRHTLTRGDVLLREQERCNNFREGLERAERWFS
jgi:hypothetical protein